MSNPVDNDDSMDGKPSRPRNNRATNPNDGSQPSGGPPGPPPPGPPPPGPTDWRYVPTMSIVSHLADHCNCCNAFLQHCLAASMQDDQSYHNAMADSRMTLRRAERRIDELTRVADNYLRRLEELEEELARERARATLPTSHRADPYTSSRSNAAGTRRRLDQTRIERATTVALNNLSMTPTEVAVSQPVSEASSSATASPTTTTSSTGITDPARIFRGNPMDMLDTDEYEHSSTSYFSKLYTIVSA
jgi:hypothetical protein